MGIDNNNFTPAKLLELLFDNGEYSGICPLAAEPADAVTAAGFGLVGDMPVCAFAQNGSLDGAISTAQANKLLRLYDLALKTGCPVVGFYANGGAYIAEGNMLLQSLGKLLTRSARLSGVVPQISVILSDVTGSMSLAAASADFVISVGGARVSLDTDVNPTCGIVSGTALCTDDTDSACLLVRRLLGFLPQNNLSSPPEADSIEPTDSNYSNIIDCADMDSKLCVYSNDTGTQLLFCRIDGATTGLVITGDGVLASRDCKRIASFVRFCDAFTIPVITEANAGGFACIGSARSVLSAYSEATTPKITVITKSSFGAPYLVFTPAADMVFALSNAVISPVRPEAAAYILDRDSMNVPIPEQDRLIREYISSGFGADKAAQAGYIDDALPPEKLRSALGRSLQLLALKRESTMPKKHPTI